MSTHVAIITILTGGLLLLPPQFVVVTESCGKVSKKYVISTYHKFHFLSKIL